MSTKEAVVQITNCKLQAAITRCHALWVNDTLQKNQSFEKSSANTF